MNGQRALRAALIAGVSLVLTFGGSAAATAGTNDYPYRDSGPDVADQWGFFTRECTSFVAWRLVHNNGVIDFSNNMRGGHWGNAYEWAANAQRLGFAADATPGVGSIAYWGAGQWPAGSFGHVAWVESINSDGSVNVEEYNFGTPYAYRTRSHVRAPKYIHVRDLGTSVAPAPQPIAQTSVAVRVTNQPAPNQWYSTDISVSWHIDWGSCGSGTWNQQWDADPAAPKWTSADGYTLFSYMGASWPDGWHTHYVRWWACGSSGLVSMGPYGADRTPPSISALSFDANGHASGSTIWGPITVHGGMTDAASGPASLRLDVLHDGQWELGRAGTLSAANGWTSTFDPAGISPQDIRIHGWGADNIGNSTNNFGALWLTLAAGPPAPARPQFYSAAYEALIVPSSLRAGARGSATVGITNTSASTWPNGATGVRLSVRCERGDVAADAVEDLGWPAPVVRWRSNLSMRP